MLAAMPERVTLAFNEPVAPLVMRLATPAGETQRLEGVTMRDRSVTIALPASPLRGTYVLSWRVVSLDGHPVGGSLLFSVGEEGGRAAIQAASARNGLAAAFVLLKFVLYVALMIGVGGAVARAWLDDAAAPPPAEAPPIAAILAGFPAVILLVGLQGLDALDAPLDALARPPVWKAGLGTSFGVTAIVAALTLFAGLFAALASASGPARAISLAALAGIGLSLAASGHASAASPQILMRPSVFLHAVAIALWIGSLLPLMRALRGDDAASVLRRFSCFAPGIVLVLIVSGIALAVVQVVRIEALWTTGYGVVLLAKLALVLVLLGIAAFNRLVLTPGAMRGNAGAKAKLRRTIAAEILLAVSIFGAAGLWRFTPPPRVIVAAEQAPDFVHIHGAKAMADITFAPPVSGRRTVSIFVQTPSFTLLAPKEVTLRMANPAAGIEPLTFPARSAGDGIWTVHDVIIPVGGTWNIGVDILIDDFERAVLEEAIELKR